MMRFLHWLNMYNLKRLQREVVKQRALHSRICKDNTCIGHVL